MTIKDVKIDRGGGQREDATKFFTLKVALAGADRGYQKQLETCLHGHWRESRLAGVFKSKGDYFFSSAAPEVVRVDEEGKEAQFTTEVIERNYSSGRFKLRLVSDDISLQFDVSLVDGKTLRTQLTHISLGGKGYREVKEEARARLANELVYVDRKERP